ncbi:MAG: hypothetical protein ACKVOQ_22635 [Cyclobacteriaceae bacterium]
MIISKPQTSTITSFVFFLLITFIVLGMNVWAVINTLKPAWYNYAVIGLLAPIGGFVLYKIFIRYKIIRLGNNQIEVSFPVLKQFKKYTLSEVQFWFENQVKTGKNSVYRELVIKFVDGKKISLSPKESTEYEHAIQYLKQKLPKKKVAIG